MEINTLLIIMITHINRLTVDINIDRDRQRDGLRKIQDKEKIQEC